MSHWGFVPFILQMVFERKVEGILKITNKMDYCYHSPFLVIDIIFFFLSTIISMNYVACLLKTVCWPITSGAMNVEHSILLDTISPPLSRTQNVITNKLIFSG